MQTKDSRLIRLKDCDDDEEKFIYKAKKAVDKLTSTDICNRPIVMIVYTQTCGHCNIFMKDTIRNGKREKSVWRSYRRTLLNNGFVVIQVNVAAAKSFVDELKESKDKRLEGIKNAIEKTAGVPSIFGFKKNSANPIEYEGSRDINALESFMRKMQQKNINTRYK